MSEVIRINTDDAVKQTSEQRKSITTFELVPETDPILREVMPTFDFENPPTDPTELASKLVDTCMKRNAFGLSANQCGLRYRVFVLGSDEEYVGCFNPEIIELGDKEALDVEGCLTFPLLGLKVKRPDRVKFKYQDYNGEWHEVEFHGFSARVFLHELDHLNGILYTDRAGPMALKMGQKKRDKYNKLVDRYETAQKKIKKYTA